MRRILVLAALSLGAVLPALLAGEPAVAARGGELRPNWWLLWWVGRRLEMAPGDLFTLPRELQLGNYLDILVVLPWQGVVGAPLLWNLRSAGVLFLNGLAGYLLGREVGGGPRAAFAGAALLALAPFALGRLGTAEVAQAVLAGPALAIWGHLRAERAGTLRDWARAGALLGLCGVLYWYGLATGLVLSLRRHRARHTAAWLAGAALVAGPWLVGVLGGGAESPLRRGLRWGRPFPPLGVALLDREAASTPPLPGPGMILERSASLSGMLLGASGLSLVALGAALAGLQGQRFWGWTGGAAALFALGPYLKPGADPLLLDGGGFPLPYLLVYRWVPFMARLYDPSRLLALAVVCLAVPAVRAAGRSRGGTGVLAAGLLVEALARGAFPLPVTPLEVPSFYRDIDCGVIEGSYPYGSARAAFYQVFHGEKLLGGQAQFWPRFGDDPRGPFHPSALPRTRRSNSFLAWLEAPGVAPRPLAEDVRVLLEAGYCALVLHDPPEAALQVLGPAASRDRGAALWRLDEVLRRLGRGSQSRAP